MNTERPPLGIMPEFMWKEIRLQQIDNAVDRYEAAGKPVPTAWADEHSRLSEWLVKHNSKKEKERIEVFGVTRESGAISNLDGSAFSVYRFNSHANIQKEKYPAIKQAIEQVLNDEQPARGNHGCVNTEWEVKNKYTVEVPPGKYNFRKHIVDKWKEAPVVGEPKEEQKPSRDWQVDGFTNGERNWWRQKDGSYTHLPFDKGFDEQHGIDNLQIRSVKRLSDGEVFSVGDTYKACDSCNVKKIVSFHIQDGRMLFKRDDGMLSTQFDKITHASTPLTHDYVTRERCNELRKCAFDAARMTSGSIGGVLFWDFEHYDKDCKI